MIPPSHFLLIESASVSDDHFCKESDPDSALVMARMTAFPAQFGLTALCVVIVAVTSVCAHCVVSVCVAHGDSELWHVHSHVQTWEC